MSRLLCVHQNRLFRQLLVSVFSNLHGFSVEEVDHTKPDHRKQIAASLPDIVLLDLSLPERLSVDLSRYITENIVSAKVILLIPGANITEQACDKLVECIEMGTHGFVLEECTLTDLRAAIEKVAMGQKFYSEQIVEPMFAQLAMFSRESRWRSRAQAAPLTQRELEVLRWIAEGLSNKQVAKKLSLSLYTVKNHVHNILDKLQVPDRRHAVEFAVHQRLFRAPAMQRAFGDVPANN
jgi:two-component system NarL family response regulator